MLIAIVPLLFAVLGLVLYFAAVSNAKVAETGRIVFFAAMIALMFALASHTVKIG